LSGEPRLYNQLTRRMNMSSHTEQKPTEETASDNKTKYNEMQVKYIFNCKDQKVAVIEGKKLNSAGDVVQSDKYEDVTWVKAEPDTVIHHAMGYTCDYVN